MLTKIAAQQLLAKYQTHLEVLKATSYTFSSSDGEYLEKVIDTLKMIASSDEMNRGELFKTIIDFWQLTHDNEGIFEAILNNNCIDQTSKIKSEQFLHEEALIRHILVYKTSLVTTVDNSSFERLIIAFPSLKIKDDFLQLLSEENKNLVNSQNAGFEQSTMLYIWFDSKLEQTFLPVLYKFINATGTVKSNILALKNLEIDQYLAHPLKIDLLKHEKFSNNNEASNSQRIYSIGPNRSSPVLFKSGSGDYAANLEEQAKKSLGVIEQYRRMRNG